MTIDQIYSEFFSKLYEFSPFSASSVFVLALFRLGPIVTLAPFLGAKLPTGPKMGLLIILTIVFLPQIALTTGTPVLYTPELIYLCIKEVFIGFILAFLINIPFQFASTAGFLIDFLRGASSLQITDQFSQGQTSPIGNLYNYVLIAVFYNLGGAFYFFNSIFTSYTLIPADAFINPLFFSAGQPFWTVIMALTTKVLALAIQLSAPSLLAILMTEVFLGIANRLAPQVQIAYLGLAIKSLLGLALLCMGWMFILQQVEKQTLLWLKEIDALLLLIPVKG